MMTTPLLVSMLYRMSTESNPSVLSYRRIIAFWIPLAVMWLIMAVEQPAVTAVIARMSEPAVNLAAFGVVFAIALVAESPIIQMLSAATALTGNRWDYGMLLKLLHILAISLTILHLIIGLTPAYDVIVGGLLDVPDNVLEASRWPFVVMAPFSAAVGYRRFWQGTLIRHGKTWIVPISIVIRLMLVAGILAMGFFWWDVSGAMLGAIAIAGGVIIAAVVAGVLNRIAVLPHLPEPREDEERLGWHGLLQFYVPLSLTTVVFLMARPVLTFGIARSQLPELSLAVWPVLNGFLFLFNSIALSYQETAIALLKQNPENRDRLGRFTHMLAVGLSGLMLVAAVTPLRELWFRGVSGLTPDLLELVPLPLLVLTLVPALVTLKSWSRSRYVHGGRTRVLAEGSVIYTIALFGLVFAGAAWLSIPGAITAAAALTLSQGVENGYLLARGPNRERRIRQ